MIKTDLDHCHCVSGALAGKRSVDEQVSLSMEILKDRLERVKRLDRRFAKISFSPMAESLATRPAICAVG